ncbi:organomercurial lyase MerB [Actinomadura nitritigenes]|uniref:organomercurial lyase MerB n=1 Tax=Actinomadura nitritigenes TaxID=134602 RepID=UPI00369B2240
MSVQQPHTPTIQRELAARIVASVAQPTSARTTPGLYQQLLRLLAAGRPVSLAELADASGRPPSEIEEAVAAWADAEYDEQGRIIGHGLTLKPTPHSFLIDGARLYTWCALDTLFFPAVLGLAAEVESPCPATGHAIRLRVDPTAGISALTPPSAVVTVVAPQRPSSLRAEFCDPGRFFASADAARPWQNAHPGMSILSVADAYEISRPLAATLTSSDGPSVCC